MKKVVLILLVIVAAALVLQGCTVKQPQVQQVQQEAQTQVREANYAGQLVRFKALLYYTEYAEEAHVRFSRQAIEFFDKLTVGDGWTLDIATSIADWTDARLKEYNVIICPDGLPASSEERPLFERYMDNGGGCVAFHASGYNDANTNWPWLLEFLGCGFFKCNNWPPQPVLLTLDVTDHPVTKNLPSEFVAPASEWYQWADDLRAKPNIEVLVSLSPKNYPLGLKDIVYCGDWPVVWTNTNYRMIYLNMGHGDEEFTDATQNLLFINAFRWVVSNSLDGNPFDK